MKTETKYLKFEVDSSGTAWELVRFFDNRGVQSGFPSLTAPFTVQTENTEKARESALIFGAKEISQ